MNIRPAIASLALSLWALSSFAQTPALRTEVVASGLQNPWGVAFIDGERLVKRLHHRHGRVALVAENPAYPSIEIRGEMELVVWGVVVGKFKRLG